jgi:hypothetical protein
MLTITPNAHIHFANIVATEYYRLFGKLCLKHLEKCIRVLFQYYYPPLLFRESACPTFLSPSGAKTGHAMPLYHKRRS